MAPGQIQDKNKEQAQDNEYEQYRSREYGNVISEKVSDTLLPGPY